MDVPGFRSSTTFLDGACARSALSRGVGLGVGVGSVWECYLVVLRLYQIKKKKNPLVLYVKKDIDLNL